MTTRQRRPEIPADWQVREPRTWYYESCIDAVETLTTAADAYATTAAEVRPTRANAVRWAALLAPIAAAQYALAEVGRDDPRLGGVAAEVADFDAPRWPMDAGEDARLARVILRALGRPEA